MTPERYFGDHPFVWFARDPRIGQELSLLGRPDERPSVGPVVERTNTERVASADQTASGCIPESEGKVAKQMVRAGGAPPVVCAQDERDVRETPRVGVQLERGDQPVTVVETAVKGQHPPGRPVDEGKIGRGACRRTEGLVSHADRTGDGIRRPVRTTVGRRGRETVERGAVHRTAAEVDDAGDAAHSTSMSPFPASSETSVIRSCSRTSPATSNSRSQGSERGTRCAVLLHQLPTYGCRRR